MQLMKCECDKFTYKRSPTGIFNQTAVLFVVSGTFVHLNILFIIEVSLVLFWCSVMPICEPDLHFITQIYRFFVYI